jgi:hypothetical protein
MVSHNPALTVLPRSTQPGEQFKTLVSSIELSDGSVVTNSTSSEIAGLDRKSKLPILPRQAVLHKTG